MNELLANFSSAEIEQVGEIAERRIVDTDHYIEDKQNRNPYVLKYEPNAYSTQYYKMYQNRLSKIRRRVVEACEIKWDAGFSLNGQKVVRKDKVLDIIGYQPCWCVGSIYCEMKYKPNILEEVINDTYLAPDLKKSYVGTKGIDEVMLEDESGRVLLVGDFIRKTPFITGAIIGVLGMEAEAGSFQVLDICYPSTLPQQVLPKIPADFSGSKVALVSGLNINTSSPGRLLKLQLLQEYLMGRVVPSESVNKIGKLIILGNSVEYELQPNDDIVGPIKKCLEEFGKFLANTLQTISVDLMPGAKDPSDRTLPQQPLHKALFQESLQPYFDTINSNILNLTTNPSRFTILGWDVLATSGQNIEDICKYIVPSKSSPLTSRESTEDGVQAKLETTPYGSPIDSSLKHRLDLAECTLNWQNIAPTAPDTLLAYPYKDKDPFVLDALPHIYIIGNQPEFGTRDVQFDSNKKVRIISVPDYSATGVIVLLDVNTLECETVQIEM